MYQLLIEEINVVDRQKDLYHFNITIYFNDIELMTQYHTSFSPMNQTIKYAVDLVCNYNSNYGVFQSKIFQLAHKENNVNFKYVKNTKDKFIEEYGKLIKIV